MAAWMDVRTNYTFLWKGKLFAILKHNPFGHSVMFLWLLKTGNQIETYGKYDNCSFGNFYSNLQNLTDTSLKRLANDTVQLYCSNDVVDGVQVDLEPYRDIYQKPLSKYVGYLADFMLDENKTTGIYGPGFSWFAKWVYRVNMWQLSGCRNEAHPHGRTVSYYAFAHDIANSTNVPVKTFNKLVVYAH